LNFPPEQSTAPGLIFPHPQSPHRTPAVTAHRSHRTGVDFSTQPLSTPTEKQGMSVPRQVLAGTRYLVTRRCTQRQFWLRPSAQTNRIVGYCIAWAAKKTGVVIHAYCVMSNHWHAVVTDVEGNLPDFLHKAHLYISKCINASYGRWENLWASEATSAVRLEEDADVLDKIAYCLANPVAGGLVSTGAQWPGLRSTPQAVAGSTQTIKRPAVYFRKTGKMPQKVTLETVRPDIYAHMSDNEFARLVSETVEAREASARAEMLEQGRKFLGAKAVLAQDPGASPFTREQRRGLSPRVAAKNKWARAEALQRHKSFLDAYRKAYQSLVSGQLDVVFPAGTYALRKYHHVTVATT
jgi:REP element-mobilizing transposase RayT